MAKSILPSIIARSQKELDERFEKVKSGSNIHLDIMDGKFVKQQSLNFPFKLPKEKREYQAHLMVQNPLAWIDKNAHKVDTIIFHIESYHKFSKIQDTIKLIKEKHKKVGIAINPLTPVKSIQHLVKNINLVLLMTVHPGRYGSRFIVSALKKANKIKSFNPKIKIQIDGGINDKTLERAKRYGDAFVVGSDIQNDEHPKQVMKKLTEIANS
jgi:ribulose-phosphate 3-epimerase